MLASRAMSATPAGSPSPGATTPHVTSPEAMRAAMAGYVEHVHRAYLDASQTLPPADRMRLPLLSAGRFTVLAVASRNLHVIGTVDRLASPRGQEVEVDGALEDLVWSLRFLDPVVLPPLGLIDESQGPRPDEVREVIGVRSAVYHLSVSPGAGLTSHHAQHAGTGLAHSHASALRNFDELEHRMPGHAPWIREMRRSHAAGIVAAEVALAQRIGTDPALLDLDPFDPQSGARARALLLAQARQVQA